jgi:signal transduction histidine kinase
MSRILVAIGLSLILIFLVGIRTLGLVALLPDISERVIFAFAILFGMLHVRTVIRSEHDRKKTMDLTLNLESANIRLTQLDKLKSEFLSFASHQIKAPMTVVKGYAQLIMDGSYGPVTDKLREVVEKIKSSSDRMIGLVDTFLNLRRIDEGRIQYRMESVNLGDLTASIVDEMRQLADTKGLRLSLRTPSRSWSVSADTQHLRQVIQNLVDNSIKYTDKGSVDVGIVEGATPNTAVLEVRDTGRGISRELAPKLFEQFSRDQSISKEIAGTGLGLYIARRIIEAHKGRIWATSPGPGKGSTFAIELPTL